MKSKPLGRGPGWIRNAFNELRGDVITHRLIHGIGTTVTESSKGSAVNVPTITPGGGRGGGCCDEPPCPTVTLLCNSISASKSKCGFSEFGTPSSPPKKYLKSTYNGSREDTGCCASPPTHVTGPSTGHADRVYSYDSATCVLTVDYPTGTYDSVHNYFHRVYCDGGYADNAAYGEGTGPYTIVSTTHKQISYSPNPQTIDCVTGGTCDGSHPCKSITRSDYFDLSDEYTTATLISNTVAALPSFRTCFSCATTGTCGSVAAGTGCTCSAFRNLSSDETSYTIRRLKYKFRFTASVTCRLKIFWNETFKPTLTAPVDFCGTHYNVGQEDPNPAHWTKTAKDYTEGFGGDPCGPDIGPPINPAGEITELDSSTFTINEPASNGTIYITDIRWSILDGTADTDYYEPAPIDYTDPCAPIAAEPNCIPADTA